MVPGTRPRCRSMTFSSTCTRVSSVFGRKPGNVPFTRPAGPDWIRALAFTGRKREYLVETLGALVGNDLYDAYIDGHVGAAALRRLFLTHLEEPGEASKAYAHLNSRLK